MHRPYRLIVLMIAAALALSLGPSRAARRPKTRRPNVGQDCAAIVPPYRDLQHQVDRLENTFLPHLRAYLETCTASVCEYGRRWNWHKTATGGRAPGNDASGDLWMGDYAQAMTAAEHRRKMLLVYFCDACDDGPCNRFKAETLDDPRVLRKLRDYVCVQVPLRAKITADGQKVKLLEHPAFQEMLGRPGIAIVDFRSSDPKLRGAVVSMFPITEKLWYTPERMAVILDLPPGTLTQRTLIYAVRIHPEKPASTSGQLNPDLLREAESHSRLQADIQVQGHHQWATRFQRIVARLPGGGTAREVCAESWPGENLVEAAIECVRCWRLSDGHWSAVRAPNRFFAYDMKRGSNGVWYATGIFGAR